MAMLVYQSNRFKMIQCCQKPTGGFQYLSISPDCEPVSNHLFYVFKDRATIHWTGHPTKSGIASEMEPRYLTAKEPMTQIDDKDDD
jgi:hypothetical protein